MAYTRTGGSWTFQFTGLSTDEKPIDDEDTMIPNGSTFLEMDTSDVYIYDKENTIWLKL